MHPGGNEIHTEGGWCRFLRADVGRCQGMTASAPLAADRSQLQVFILQHLSILVSFLLFPGSQTHTHTPTHTVTAALKHSSAAWTHTPPGAFLWHRATGVAGGLNKDREGGLCNMWCADHTDETRWVDPRSCVSTFFLFFYLGHTFLFVCVLNVSFLIFIFSETTTCFWKVLSSKIAAVSVHLSQ